MVLFRGDYATDNVAQIATVTYPGPTIATVGACASNNVSGFGASDISGTYVVTCAPTGNNPGSVRVVSPSGTLTLVTGSSLTVDFTDPAFSHDGAWIAYLSDATTNGAMELFVVPSGGGTAKRLSPILTLAAMDVAVFTWRRDSTAGSEYLAFIGDVNADNVFELFTIDVVPASPTRTSLTPGATTTMNVSGNPPAFDSSGRVYFRGDLDVDNLFRLYRANVDGSMLMQVPGTALTNASGEARGGPFGMSPDGLTLAFGSEAPTANVYQLYKLPLSTTTATQISNVTNIGSGGSAYGPDLIPPIEWSPDGMLLTIAADWQPANDSSEGEMSAWVIPVSGSGAVRVMKVPQGSNQDVDRVFFTRDSSRIFIIADALVNNDTLLLSTNDLTTPNQSAAGLVVQSVVTGGDIADAIPLP